MAAKFGTTIFKTLVDRALSPENRSRILAGSAKHGLETLISTGRASPQYIKYVDGLEGRAEESVKPDGVIVYEFGYLGEVVAFALAYLRTRSPVGKPAPHYKDSFMVAVNGKKTPAANFQPSTVPRDAVIMIFNDRPYGRKVDQQLAGGRVVRYKVKANIFADAGSAVRAQFKGLVLVERIRSVEFSGRLVTKKGKTVEYPGIEIRLR